MLIRVMRPVIPLVLATAFLAYSQVPLFAHPGPLDKQGCHSDRRIREYHCHENPRGLPSPETEPVVSPPPEVRLELYFRSCDEARAAGYKNIRRGEPGYRPGLDRDNDGIACEPYRGR